MTFACPCRLGDALAPVAGTRHPILQYREGKVLMRLERWGEAVKKLVRASGSDPLQVCPAQNILLRQREESADLSTATEA